MARKTKQEAQETRERILDAAERLFHSQGVSQTSLQDIAAAAEVTRGAIYWHFKDKVEVFNAMMDRATMPLEEGMSPPAAEGQAPAQALSLVDLRWGLVNVFHSTMHNARTRRAFEIVSQKVEFAGELISLQQRQLDAHLRWRGENRACFEQAVKLGQLPPDLDTERAAITLVALVGGLIDEWIMAPESFNLLEVGQAAVETYLACLAGKQQAALPPLSDDERARLGQVAVCPIRPRTAQD